MAWSGCKAAGVRFSLMKEFSCAVHPLCSCELEMSDVSFLAVAGLRDRVQLFLFENPRPRMQVSDTPLSLMRILFISMRVGDCVCGSSRSGSRADPIAASGQQSPVSEV
jgi:hypothetical protein